MRFLVDEAEGRLEQSLLFLARFGVFLLEFYSDCLLFLLDLRLRLLFRSAVLAFHSHIVTASLLLPLLTKSAFVGRLDFDLGDFVFFLDVLVNGIAALRVSDLELVQYQLAMDIVEVERAVSRAVGC